jgi:hypothetical protein
MPISAPYHHLRDMAVAAVDSIFAEPIRIVPLGTSSIVEIDAVLRTGAQVSQSVSGGRGQTWQTEVAGASATLHVDIVKYPDLKFSKGDVIRALSRPDEPWFEVARSDPRTASRQVVYLTEG